MSTKPILHLVRQLRVPGSTLSRNRAFETFETPHGRIALRLHRCLKDLEQDLGRDDETIRVRLRTDAGGSVQVTVERPRLRLERTLHLEPEVLPLLLASPGVAARRLRQAAERDVPELVRAPPGDRSPR